MRAWGEGFKDKGSGIRGSGCGIRALGLRDKVSASRDRVPNAKNLGSRYLVPCYRLMIVDH